MVPKRSKGYYDLHASLRNPGVCAVADSQAKALTGKVHEGPRLSLKVQSGQVRSWTHAEVRQGAAKDGHAGTGGHRRAIKLARYLPNLSTLLPLPRTDT